MKFKIGKRIFNIEFVKELDDEFDDAWALVKYIDKNIQIKNTNELEKRVSLLHEIMHIIFRSMGYEEHEEHVIHGIAERLYEVLLDNPDIIEYLTDKSI